MTTIENKFLKITIKQLGGEMTSLFSKETNTEMLWQGNPEFWNGQAPILFPTVGNLKDNAYLHNETRYKLGRHGFARRSNDWTVKKVNETTITATLESNEASLKIYPFQFKLVITYVLEGKKVILNHTVTNQGDEKLPFSIGGHTAYNILEKGSKHEDYFLEFSEIETDKRYFLNNDGLVTGKTEIILDNTDTLQITENLFNKDALVFKHLKSNSISLSGPKGQLLKVTFEDFPYIGIWASPKAPFVCIEPWIGHADTINSNYNLFDKEGSISLEPSKNFEASYEIAIFV